VFSKLLGLSYTIVYRRGTDNRAADALSRYPVGSRAALSVAQPQWLAAVADSYVTDAYAQSIIAKLLLDGQSVPNFAFSNGLLRYKSRIWIGHNQSLQAQLITALHTNAVGGHSSIPVTLRRLKQFFAWRDMNAAVRDFVAACTICQQAKPDAPNCQVSYSLCQFQTVHGKSSPSISLKACPFLDPSTAYWWWWILFPDTLTFWV
jgi:hypothetical protein